MLTFCRKYDEKFSSVILIGYLIISFLTVFHFHHYELAAQVAVSEDETDNSTRTVNPNGTICIIHQNFTLLHSVTFSDLTNSPFNLPCVNESISFDKPDNQSLLLHFSNGLRAPPAFFS
jgi:hypothetical protein